MKHRVRPIATCSSSYWRSKDLKADCKKGLTRQRLGSDDREIDTKFKLVSKSCVARSEAVKQSVDEVSTRTTTMTKNDRAHFAGRCSPLDVSTSVSGSRWPRTGLLSSVSPNQKTDSVQRADWLDTATVKTAIGQPARVTHGYRLHQQHLRSISAARYYQAVSCSPLRRASPVHTINTYTQAFWKEGGG